MFFNRENKNYIAVEELHIRHLNLLIDLKNNEFNNWFYKMAIINTFEDLKKFLINLEKNKNKCIIAIQNKKVIGFIHTYPINKKKTCLKVDEPKIYDCKYPNNTRELILELLKKTIFFNDVSLSNWIITSDINNLDLISASRELGFQPLKETKVWTIPKQIKNITQSIENDLLIESFQKIDETNIKSILNFVRSNESIMVRNLLDYSKKDIEKRNDDLCGCITINGEIIFTILKDINYKKKKIYTLMRGICWDERLNTVLELVIKKIIKNNPNVIFKTYSEDKALNKFLQELPLNETKNELILIKNSLIKRNTINNLSVNKSLDSILKKINPPGNPFPAPTPSSLK